MPSGEPFTPLDTSQAQYKPSGSHITEVDDKNLLEEDLIRKRIEFEMKHGIRRK